MSIQASLQPFSLHVVTESMEKITLRFFWVCMLACASCVIVGIWCEGSLPEEYFKVPATLFIIGLANFLLWAPLIVYRFLAK